KLKTVISMPDLIEMIVFKVFTSWRGPNTEADEKSAYNNVQVGDGPQQREIGFPISTDNASWGGTTK
ncbi:hypothetical protein, partial [Staphylococcus aureus]|uniref:hypothetical protein n=1 Tax=Staphylococcus aureus TaxID=1280 RepID=UPI0021760E60